MEPDQTSSDYIVATYEEIRLRFGLGSTDAARIKAKRRKWSPEPLNHPGAVARIRVPRRDWEDANQVERSRGIDRDRPRSIKDLEIIATIFREERDQFQAERDRLVAERDAARTEAAKLREEREEARIRGAQAESETKGLREALAEARRPWWRKMLGT